MSFWQNQAEWQMVLNRRELFIGFIHQQLFNQYILAFLQLDYIAMKTIY